MVQPVKRKKHLFTSKKMSMRALMSDCLGAIAATFTCVTVYLTFRNGGQATPRYATAFFLCIVMARVGLIIAILSRKERDIYYFFSYLGMALNGAVLLAGAGVMYLGLR